MKSVAILMRKAPYGSVYSAEGYRAMMGLGVFERIWQRIDNEGLITDDGRDIRDMTDDQVMDWVVEQQHAARGS